MGPFVQWCVIVTSMKISKIDDKRIGLNLNLKHKFLKKTNQEHEMCTIKVQTNFYWNELSKCKHKNNITRI